MMRKLLRIFSSLKLTIICLFGVMVLVFLGTMEQVSTGVSFAQERYFRSFFVIGTPFHIPYFPGGYTFGILLLLNLFAGYFTYFRFTLKKTGILLIHSGIALLIIGEIVNGFYSTESQMPIRIGEVANYSEVPRDTEFVLTDLSHPEYDQVVSLPTSLLKQGKKIVLPTLPFTIRTNIVYPNAELALTDEDTNTSFANRGLGTKVQVEPLPPVNTDDRANTIAASVELLDQGRSIGSWLLSNAITAPQIFRHGGKEYEIAIRRKRIYYPFSIELNKFTHTTHPGTTIPKEFSSLIHLYHADGQLDRKVDITMNHPLRYQGKSFYQASFGEEDNLSILQVVENPGRSLPYIASTIVGLGLLIQFIIGFYHSKTKV